MVEVSKNRSLGQTLSRLVSINFIKKYNKNEESYEKKIFENLQK